jgi:hypothetical protein
MPRPSQKFFSDFPSTFFFPRARTISIADAHRERKRFVVRADEKLTAFLELEAATAGRSKSSTGRCNGKSR